MSIFEERVMLLWNKIDKMKLDALIITCLEHAFYLSGYLSSREAKPVVLIIPKKGTPSMIMAEHELPLAQEISWIKDLRPYYYYTIKKVSRIEDQIADLTIKALQEKFSSRIKVGLEFNFAPFFITEQIKQSFASIEFLDIGRILEEMRLIKSEPEIKAIKKTAQISLFSQKIAQEMLRDGISEIEIFSEIEKKLQKKVGERIILEGDFVSGERTIEGGGQPTNRRLRKNDLVISDLFPCYNGYWADTCRTFAVGKMSTKQKELFKVIEEALKKGMETVRPGVRVSQVDKTVRDFIISKGYGDYFPHHTGHGIGLTHFEAPMIVPHNDQELRPGMVITIEPGIYMLGIGGVRIEEDILISDEGKEVFTRDY